MLHSFVLLLLLLFFPFSLISAVEIQFPATAIIATLETSATNHQQPPIPLFYNPANFQSPVPDPSKISNTFGPRWQSGKSRYDFHRGIDYFDANNTEIFACADGVVFETHNLTHGSYPGGGNVVILEHTLSSSVPNSLFHGATLEKFWSYYFHLNVIEVVQGATVTKGTRLGLMGETGVATSIHLHFETRLQGRCSYEFQIASGKTLPQGGSTCYTGFDPHVHPFLFVGTTNSSSTMTTTTTTPTSATTGVATKYLHQIQPLNSSFEFAIRFNTTRAHLDLDEIRTNFGSINFDLRRLSRPGMANKTFFTTLAELDDLARLAPFMVMIPGTFNRYTGDEIFYDFHFWTAAPTFFEAIDIYGDGVRWPKLPVDSTTTTTTTTMTATTVAGASTTTTTAAGTTTTVGTTTTSTTTSTSTTSSSSQAPTLPTTTAAATSSSSSTSAAPTPPNSTSGVPGDSAAGSNVALIAGAAGGGGFVLILLVVFLLIFFVRRRREEDENKKRDRGGDGNGVAMMQPIGATGRPEDVDL